jgi:hypothetical protein
LRDCAELAHLPGRATYVGDVRPPPRGRDHAGLDQLQAIQETSDLLGAAQGDGGLADLFHCSTASSDAAPSTALVLWDIIR